MSSQAGNTAGQYPNSSTSSGSSGGHGGYQFDDNVNLGGFTLQVTHHVKAALLDSPLIPLPPNFYNAFKDLEEAGEKFTEVVKKEKEMVEEEIRKFTVRCAFGGKNPAMEFAGPDRTALDKLHKQLEELIELVNKSLRIRYIDTKGWLPNEIKHLNSNILKKLQEL